MWGRPPTCPAREPVRRRNCAPGPSSHASKPTATRRLNSVPASGGRAPSQQRWRLRPEGAQCDCSDQSHVASVAPVTESLPTSTQTSSTSDIHYYALPISTGFINDGSDAPMYGPDTPQFKEAPPCLTVGLPQAVRKHKASIRASQDKELNLKLFLSGVNEEATAMLRCSIVGQQATYSYSCWQCIS